MSSLPLMPPGAVPAQQQEIDLVNPPFPLTAIDRSLLAMRDEDFHLITWADLRAIIDSNTLEELKRRPSDLRRYLAWSHAIKTEYGGIVPFVVRERLRWTPLPNDDNTAKVDGNDDDHDQDDKSQKRIIHPPRFKYISPIPFTHPSDYAVLVNDWPYGFAPGITHLVVWSKTPIATDAERGMVTATSHAQIEAFVQEFFVRDLSPTESRPDARAAVRPRAAGDDGDGQDDGNDEADDQIGHVDARDRVLWFKNWVALQSVRGVDHVHVLVRDATPEQLAKWTVRKDI